MYTLFTPGITLSLKDVAARLNITPGNAGMALLRLIKDKRLKRTDPNTYLLID